jgi:hypothetical protein
MKLKKIGRASYSGSEQISAVAVSIKKSQKHYTIQHDINIKEGIIAIKFNIFMLQRELITVTDVFEKSRNMQF